MNFRSIADLNAAIVGNLHQLSANVDLVVGIPRSGLLAANILACHANRPLADLDGFIEGRELTGGRTRPASLADFSVTTAHNVLVIDDSVRTGVTLARARQRIEALSRSHSVRYAAVFAAPEATNLVDVYCEVCPRPRIFEWNMLHHEVLEDACLDIDGVLCRDPRREENDDGPQYQTFLEQCEPLFVPARPVGYLVTCRLEKYRAETEQWLRQNGIAYHELVMMDYPTKAARVAAGSHAEFKADVYRRTPTRLFIESSERQAAEIAKRSQKPVLCLETRSLFDHSQPGRVTRMITNLPSRALRKIGIVFGFGSKRSGSKQPATELTSIAPRP